jgi:hypothetical protein
VPVKVAYRTTTPWWSYLCVWTEFTVTVPACGHMECLLAKLLSELTTDAPSEPWSIRYRRNYLISLRVDDVLIIGETAWLLTESGFQPKALQADEVAVIPGLTRMRERQSKVNKWGGDWEAFTRYNARATRDYAARSRRSGA